MSGHPGPRKPTAREFMFFYGLERRVDRTRSASMRCPIPPYFAALLTTASLALAGCSSAPASTTADDVSAAPAPRAAIKPASFRCDPPRQPTQGDAFPIVVHVMTTRRGTAAVTAYDELAPRDEVMVYTTPFDTTLSADLSFPKGPLASTRYRYSLSLDRAMAGGTSGRLAFARRATDKESALETVVVACIIDDGSEPEQRE